MSEIALVTGGARGIGFGVSKALAKEGVDIAVFGTRGADAVADAMAEIAAFGVRTCYSQGSITCAADREAALDKIEAELGPINFLVNNAGIAPKVRADILEATEESFETVLKTNLQGPYFMTQAVAKRMAAQKKANPSFRGGIVNVSSISATVVSTSRGEYCISKAGVSMATQLWAARLAEFGINVYEVRPGVIKTDMTSVVTAKYDKLISEGLCLIPRWGYPEDIGKAIAMLWRGDLAYTTGQVLMIDGGMTISQL